MLPFSDTRPDSFSVHARILRFPSTRPNSTNFRYSHCFYPFPKLVWKVFQYWHGFFLFPVLAPSLPFSGTHTDSTLFRNSSGQFFNSGTNSTCSPTRPNITIFRNSSREFFNSGTDSTFCLYSPGFYHLLILTQILPFSDTRPDSTIFRYSHWFYLFSKLVRTVF